MTNWPRKVGGNQEVFSGELTLVLIFKDQDEFAYQGNVEGGHRWGNHNKAREMLVNRWNYDLGEKKKVHNLLRIYYMPGTMCNPFLIWNALRYVVIIISFLKIIISFLWGEKQRFNEDEHLPEVPVMEWDIQTNSADLGGVCFQLFE